MFELPPAGSDFWVWMGFPIWQRSDAWEALIYAWFNLVEAAAWWMIGIYVFVRYVRFRRSWVEPMYVALLVVFGLNDVLEAQRVTLWLIVAKGLVFTNLVTARLYLVSRFYVGRRV